MSTRVIMYMVGGTNMPMTPKEMVRLLKKNGFVEVGQSGSHLKLINHETGKRTVVPVHGKDLKKGLEKAILKQEGLSK